MSIFLFLVIAIVFLYLLCCQALQVDFFKMLQCAFTAVGGMSQPRCGHQRDFLWSKFVDFSVNIHNFKFRQHHVLLGQVTISHCHDHHNILGRQSQCERALSADCSLLHSRVVKSFPFFCETAALYKKRLFSERLSRGGVMRPESPFRFCQNTISVVFCISRVIVSVPQQATFDFL